ncbi:MAG TPA: hypothetical protein PKA02_02695 [Candidatus Saccharibacteria bacterium]|nr:hypothetical protein [Candidatus Saccharibacteria bacterium]
MQELLLKKIRLSWYFVIFFVFYAFLAVLLPRQQFEGGALTLFSVNSFLYGFYISPILSAQKGRIEDLHKIVREEANALFAMVLATKNLPEELRNKLQEMFRIYIRNNINYRHAAAEKDYESLITFCLDYKGPEKKAVDSMLDKLVANQKNRTMFSMQIANKVFSNEWMIMLMLFSITLTFILILDTGSGLILRFVTALLCTGLTMLLVILVKLSTLTHKKAKQVWLPLQKLADSHFYRID